MGSTAAFDVDEVLKKATNLQKWQLLSGADFWSTAPLEEFNVPSVRVTDGPNGIRGSRFFASVPAACIPCGTALGATWDKTLMYRAGELLGNECKAKGAHCWLGPTINIQRSPLGGRGFESYSEDPYLSGALAVAIVKGCEGTGVQATPKHFVCNDQEHERRAVDTILSERALREVYLRPFQIVARDAKPGCLMTSYNKINGTHVSHDKRLLADVVRTEWGWNPLIISDWFGTMSTVQALKAGLDLEMPGKTRWRGALGEFAQTSRLLKQSVIDARARKVLEFVQRASRVEVAKVEGCRDLAADRILNRELCGKSIVLLKNEGDVLPLPKRVRKIALIGSHMKVPSLYGGGSAALKPYYSVTPFNAINAKLSEDVEVVYEIGAYAHKMLPIIGSMLKTPGEALQGAILNFFNHPRSVSDRESVGTEVIPEVHIQLMDYKNPKLNHDLFFARIDAIFTPDISGLWDFGMSVCGTANLFLDGELLIDETTQIQEPGGAFFGKGTRERIGSCMLVGGRQYGLTIEFGSSKTSTIKQLGVVSFEGGGIRVGACLRVNPEIAIQNAVAAAADADYAIICTGLSAAWESEGFDRPNMNLPVNVDEMISRVISANPNTVIVTQSGTPVAMPWICSAKAVLHAWYGGNETGNGVADILFGDLNPSAKLPVTWPKILEDNPSFLNFGSVQGRVLYGEDVYVGYKFYDAVKRDPLFAFGFGLSYTTFRMVNLKTTQENVSLSITNTGRRAGAQVIQVYVSPRTSAIQRPIKELHGFEKIFLDSGESADVNIKIDRYAGSLWDEMEERWLLEAGEYEVLVGFNSSQLQSAGNFIVKEAYHWLGL